MARLRALLQWLNKSAKRHPSLFFKRVAYLGVCLIGASFALNLLFGQDTVQFWLLVVGLVVWGLGFALMAGLAGVEEEPCWSP